MKSTLDRLRGWCSQIPDCVLVGLLGAQAYFLLSQWYSWFAFNQAVGRAMLMALAVTGVVLLVMLFWLAGAFLLCRRFLLTLRQFLLLVVAVSVMCSWLVIEAALESRESKLAAVIRNDGGEAGGPKTRLAKLLGSDSLEVVQCVSLDRTPSTDADLLPLRTCRQLILLSLSHTRITDSGLAYLCGHRLLKNLDLDNTKITDAGLVYVARLEHLSHLSLEDTQVTDDGLLHLHGLRELSCVHLRGTKITSEGVDKLLKALPGCDVFR